jgi:glutaredoxin 3
MVNVTIYSTPTCGYCKAAKEYFKKNNVEYTEYDVANDTAKAQEMIEKSGQMGVPVILVDDEIIIGFDQSKIAKLLDIKE